MTGFPRRASSPLFSILVLSASWIISSAGRPCLAQEATTDSTAASGAAALDSTVTEAAGDSTARAVPAAIGEAPAAADSLRPDPSLAENLREIGLENVSAFRRQGASSHSDASRSGDLEVTYENRRYRHPATALGHVARLAGEPTWAFERRLGLVSAAILDPGDGELPSQVRYPSEGGFPGTTSTALLAPTRKSVDLVIGPLFTYETERLFDPTLVRFELQPELRYNPWPGAKLRAAMVIPVRNDFDADSLHPDVNKVRPGPVLIEQYAWSPGVALVSACGGLFGNNRYGMSFGMARPLRGGEFLLDAQTDFTGFVSLSDSGLTYSTPSRWTGFVGASYRPPGLDLNIRLRAARFLEADEGFEIELRRTMGDFDVALAWQHVWARATADAPRYSKSTGVVRLILPVPPMERITGRAVRVLPIERFTFQYREESLPVGVYVANLASREEYLRSLDRPSLASNAPRYQAARQGQKYVHREPEIRWVSMTGMTGFINTPWAGVMGDKELEFGYNKVPKGAAYTYRGLHDDEIYYLTMGFLPRAELGLRWTVSPGSRPFRDIVPEARYTDHDRMFSGRFELLAPRRNFPGVSIGIEDARGTRRFHSSYVVAGMPFEIYRLQNRVTLGYAPRVFRATRRTLDGLFGACEVSPWRHVAFAIEHDTEKPNASLGIDIGWGLRARAAMLDLEHFGLGAGWFKAL